MQNATTGQVPVKQADGSWAPGASGEGGGSGIVETIVAGTGISVDDSDPANPVVSAILDYAASDVSFDDTGLSVTSGQVEVQGAIGLLDAGVAQNTIDIGDTTSDLGVVTSKLNTVIEDSPDLASFPFTGSSQAFYRALDTGIIYTWNGTSYDPIGTTGGGGISEELAIAYAVSL
jgi:hypothetical protein